MRNVRFRRVYVLSINRDKYTWLLEKGEKRLTDRSKELKRHVNPSNKKRHSHG